MAVVLIEEDLLPSLIDNSNRQCLQMARKVPDCLRKWFQIGFCTVCSSFSCGCGSQVSWEFPSFSALTSATRFNNSSLEKGEAPTSSFNDPIDFA